ncbi:MAG: hypothetical protein H0V90_08400, partial [Blastocatellia bacterium]|nr:hypothetical protein [Blastocatellia bacterium]
MIICRTGCTETLGGFRAALSPTRHRGRGNKTAREVETGRPNTGDESRPFRNLIGLDRRAFAVLGAALPCPRLAQHRHAQFPNLFIQGGEGAFRE